MWSLLKKEDEPMCPDFCPTFCSGIFNHWSYLSFQFNSHQPIFFESCHYPVNVLTSGSGSLDWLFSEWRTAALVKRERAVNVLTQRPITDHQCLSKDLLHCFWTSCVLSLKGDLYSTAWILSLMSHSVWISLDEYINYDSSLKNNT